MAALRLARTTLLALAALAMAVLTACTGPATGPAPTTDPTTAATPVTLTGIWVTGVEVKSPDTPFLKINPDGTWRGSDGCNGVQGTWSLEGAGQLSTTSGPHTLIYCQGEPLPSAFINARAAVFAGDELKLLDDQGQTLATLKKTERLPTSARGTAEIVGWWGAKDVSAPRQVFLDITSDGRVTGNDGCNTLKGKWRFSPEGSVQFDPFVTSLKECSRYSPWLSHAVSALVDGDVLVVTNDVGIELGVLQRSAVPSTNNPSPSPAPTPGTK